MHRVKRGLPDLSACGVCFDTTVFHAARLVMPGAWLGGQTQGDTPTGGDRIMISWLFSISGVSVTRAGGEAAHPSTRLRAGPTCVLHPARRVSASGGHRQMHIDAGRWSDCRRVCADAARRLFGGARSWIRLLLGDAGDATVAEGAAECAQERVADCEPSVESRLTSRKWPASPSGLCAARQPWGR